MNKNFFPFVLSLVLGIALLVSTAYASAGEVSGYETYKTALKNMKTQENMTVDAAVTISDNGKELGTLNANMEVSHEENAMSGNLSVQTDTANQISQIFHQENEAVIVAGEEYYLMEKQLTENHRHKLSDNHNPEISEAAEKIVDALVGDTKNYFNIIDLENGLKEINVNLAEDQIPVILNTLVSIHAQQKDENMSFESNQELKQLVMGDIKTYLPELENDVKIQNIELTALINQENLIDSQELNMTVAGKDMDGISHTIMVSVSMNFSQFNQTAPDSIDLTNKDVNIVKLDPSKRHK